MRKNCNFIENIKLEVKYKVFKHKTLFWGVEKEKKHFSDQLKIQLFSTFSVQPQYNFLHQKSRIMKSVVVQCEKVWGSLKQYLKHWKQFNHVRMEVYSS